VTILRERSTPPLSARVVLVLLLLSLQLAAGHELLAETLRVHFIDVGQGGAVLLETDEHAVLVDAGESERAARYLSELEIHRLDLAVATHAHADHIGGFPAVFDTVEVRRLWYNGQEHTTVTFERFLDAALASEALYHEPVRGEEIAFGRLTIEVLHPEHSAAEYEGHLHDKNIVLQARYGEFSALLTGDADQSVEHELREREGLALGSTVLKLGHHGSNTSSSREFLKAVCPAVVVYQAACDNPYGHPHAEVLERVAAFTDAELFGTDRHGTIVIETDGIEYEVIPEREEAIEPPAAYRTPAAPPAVSASCESL